MNITVDDKVKLQRLITDLEMIVQEIERIDYTYQKDDFFDGMQRLWKFIRSYKGNHIINYFLHTNEFLGIRKRAKTLQEYYERSLEMDEALVIISNILNQQQDRILEFSKNIFVADNYKMVRDELKMFEQQSPKTLVMVGCGPLPETILYVTDNTDIPEIIGVDCNQEAIAMGGKVINSLGLQKRVKMKYSHGEEFDYSNADIIHVANSVYNKSDVLKKIAITSKKGAEILMRVPYGLYNILKENIISIPEELVVVKKAVVKSPLCDTYLLLEKLNY